MKLSAGREYWVLTDACARNIILNTKYRADVFLKMSFKRVGDNFDAIKVQKKFRQSELLLEDIPEDEATLMKNGRFACLVCRHNPVFDTVAMLSIHRQGKKHLANAKIRLEKLRGDTELRQKRAQEHYLKTSKPGLDQEQEKAPLLSSTQKKKELALRDSSRLCSSSQGTDQQLVKQKNLPFFQSRVPTDLKFSQGKTPSNIDVALAENAPDKEITHSQATGTSSAKSVTNTTYVSHGMKSKSTARTTRPVQLSADEKAKREHFAKLTRDGWIRDWDGTWKKDENVEFDSDEDEPPTMP